MRIRNNKKRNTAFIFECLVRSATVAILKNNATHKKKIINIIKEQVVMILNKVFILFCELINNRYEISHN